MVKKLAVVLGLAALTCAVATTPEAAQAGGCFRTVCAPVQKRVVVERQAVVYPQPNISYTYNFVGAPIREQAYAEQAVRQALEVIGETTEKITERRTEFRTAPQQQQAEPCPCPDCTGAHEQTPTGEPNQFSREELSALTNTCARCHGDQENPKAGLSLTGELDAATRLAALRKVTQKEMPPDRELSDEQAAAVITELLRLEK